MKIYETFSSEETKKFGNEIAQRIIKASNGKRSLTGQQKGAFVIALQGDLGAGKTTFTQGFFRGLGVKRNPISPTFIIMRRYKISAVQKHSFKDIYHFDAYRLKKAEDLAVLGFGEILSDPQNIILIEWPEKIERVLPKNILKIEFKYGKKENERKINIKPGFPFARER